MIKIISLGTSASLTTPNKKHFSLLLDIDGHAIWIDPSVKYDKKVDYIIVTQSDEDHFHYLKNYLKKYPNVPVLSSKGVLDNIDLKGNFKHISESINLYHVHFNFMAIPPMVGKPAIGIRLSYRNKKISIIPEFDRLGKYEQDLIKESIWIIGVGEYDKRKPNDHKATFKELLDLADRLKPERIYLTNLRKSLENKIKDIKNELSKYNGKILTEDSVITLKSKLENKLHPDEFKREGIDSDMKNVKERWRECIADLRYLGNSAYPKLKKGEKWGDWTLDLVYRYFAKLVDVLRSVYFTIIPPFDENLYREYTGKDPEKAKKSSYWKCYKESEKYMKSYPPKSYDEAKDWDKKRSEIIVTKSKIKKKYWSTAKPYYRFQLETIDEELRNAKWLNEKLLIDIKADGLRITLGKSGDEPFVYVDPELLKGKSPDVSSRLPEIIKELKELLPPNTIIDGEFIALDKDGKEILHRTVANSLLNAKKISPEELKDYAYVYAFDCLFYDGEDIRSFPLHERLEYLQRIKSSKHIWIERTTTNIDNKKTDAYIVSNISSINKAIDNIINHKIDRPKFIAEGVMIKLLSHPYDAPTNHGWGKAKIYHEYDGRVLEKHLVKGSKGTYNYWIGLDIDKDYYDALVSMKTKDWYHSVGILSDGKFYRGKDSIGKTGQYEMVLGKTDNTNIKANIGDILRIAGEEFLRYDNPVNEKFPRYSFYIGRVMELIPEKNKTDTVSLVNKLSLMEPKRIPVEELRHIRGENKLDIDTKSLLKKREEITNEIIKLASRIRELDIERLNIDNIINNKSIKKDDIKNWVESGKIPKDIYDSIAKDNEPLPKELYINPKSGRIWFQHHIRGITQEEKDAYDKGKKSLADIIKGHSVHTDMRCSVGEKMLIQWVFTDNTIQDYYKMYTGAHRKTAGGIMNVAHSLAIVKPSAEPKEVDITKKSKEKEPLIDLKGAKLIEKLDMPEYSYWIEPGDVGSNPYKWAYMSCFYIGKVKTGVARDDCHEYFFYPDKTKDDKILKGRFIIKCLKRPDKTARWEVWKAIENPKPMDSIKHADIGYNYPTKASKVKKFGREKYREESKKKFFNKL